MSEIDWVNTLVAALAVLVAAVLGGIFVLVATKRTLDVTISDAATQREEDRTAAELQYQRQLLAQAADRLLDALWTKERELCDALNSCREEIEKGLTVAPGDPALQRLGELDLAVYEDLIASLPFVHDPELRERLRTAGQVVNDGYNIRGGSAPGTAPGGTVESIGRAMIEVQAYFKWLRWNLVCALRGDALPAAMEMPNVRRPVGGQVWSTPSFVPPWT